jgi:hypothetical protein
MLRRAFVILPDSVFPSVIISSPNVDIHTFWCTLKPAGQVAEMDPSMISPSMLDQIPAIPAPGNLVSNLTDPYSLAKPGRVLIVLTMALMTIVVALRLYTRLRVTRVIGKDDYLCVAAFASVVSYCAVLLSILGDPLGPHMWNVPLSAITPRYIQGAVTTANLYAASALLLKASILVLYLRIFQADKTSKVLIWGGIILITLFYIVCIVLTSYFCRSSQWPKNIDPIQFLMLQEKSDCNKRQLDLAAVQGIFSTVSDLYVMIIPVNMIRRLQVPLRRKLGISGIFLLGLLATGCSIATLYYRFVQRQSPDFTYDSALNLILGGIEINVGIVCSCLPVVFVLFKQATTSSWTSLRSWGTRFFRRTGSRTLGKTESNRTKEPDSLNMDSLRIPRGTLTGLRTFFGGTKTKSRIPDTELSIFADMASVEEEYHSQLKTNAHTPTGGSHSNTNYTTQSTNAGRPVSAKQQV